MTQIKVNILNDFRHTYGQKDQFLREGAAYYLDVSNEQEKAELIYMMSGAFPHRNFVAVELSPELVNILNCSQMDRYAVHPESPSIAQFYFNTTFNKPYLYTENGWVEWMGGSGGGGSPGNGGGTVSVVPSLFGDVTSSGFTNEVTIRPGVITNEHISPAADIELSKLEVDPLNRANHTGVQPSNTIFDFDAQVRTNRIDQLSAPAGPLDMANQRIVNLDNPVGPADAVNKQYADAIFSSLSLNDLLPPTGDYDMAGYLLRNHGMPVESGDVVNKAYVDQLLLASPTKMPVRLVAVSNITPSGTGVNIDGRTALAGDRVLLNGQTDPRMNGIYVVSAGAWMRAGDADENHELTTGSTVTVTDGEDFGGTQWAMTSPTGPTVIGTSAIRWSNQTGLGAVDPGMGLYKNTTSIHVGGTPGRILVLEDSVDIDPAYPGQTSISTLGTISTGIWRGTPVDVTYGGTGANNAADARVNLGAAKSGVNSDISALLGLTTPISVSQGGTGADNAADARFNLQAAKSGVNSDITQLTGLTTPISVSQGGTGASDADTARANLMAAKSGANFDITSLNGLTTPLSVTQGGTGATTAPEARVMLEAVGEGINLGIGANVFSQVVNTGAEIQMSFRSLTEGSGISITQGANDVTIAMDPSSLSLGSLAGTIDLASQVSGVLPVANGGTGGTVPLEARQNLAAAGGAVSLGGTSILGSPVLDIATTNLQFKGFVSDPEVVITATGSTLRFGIDDSELDLSLMGGLLSLANQVQDTLPVANGGTGAGNANEARMNLGAVGTIVGMGAVPLVSPASKTGAFNDTYSVRGLRQGTGILLTPSASDVTISVETLDINNDLVGYPLTIPNGGTGAVTAGQALLNLGGIHEAVSAGGATLVSSLTPIAGQGFQLELKGIESAHPALTVVGTADTVELNLNPAALDINNDLSGYPLTIANGGTGATTVGMARDNLGIIYDVQSVGAGESLVDSIVDVGGEGSRLQLRGITASSAALDTVLVGSDVDITLDPSAIDINTLGGTPLDINAGGTGATTEAGARENLNVVYTANSIGSGIPILQAVNSVPGDGLELDIKSITAVTSSPVNILNNAGTIEIGLDPIDINTDLAGYPLSLANGGTGATTALAARQNLDAARSAINIGTGEGVFAAKNVNGDIELKSLVSSDSSVDISSTAGEIDITLASGAVRGYSTTVDINPGATVITHNLNSTMVVVQLVAASGTVLGGYGLSTSPNAVTVNWSPATSEPGTRATIIAVV